VFCSRCEVFIDSPRPVSFSSTELKALFAFAAHAKPERAITLDQLAAEVGMGKDETSATLKSLKEKGVTISTGDDPFRYWLDNRIEVATSEVTRPAGIELSLPLNDR
jgi:hypothetical protein